MNPYKSKWHLAILGALIQRTQGCERNPERAARIRRRYAGVIAWAKAVDVDGVPLDRSFWVRKTTGRIWRVLYLEQFDTMVRIHLPGTSEEELISFPDFLLHFVPEGCPMPAPPKCHACDGDVTFPHNHE